MWEEEARRERTRRGRAMWRKGSTGSDLVACTDGIDELFVRGLDLTVPDMKRELNEHNMSRHRGNST
eukprot:756307-Hanusia_phi.AAC.7